MARKSGSRAAPCRPQALRRGSALHWKVSARLAADEDGSMVERFRAGGIHV